MSAPELQPAHCPPACRSDVRQDKPGPTAHTHRRPSAPQAPPPPFPHCAAHRSPHDHPDIRLTHAGNAPDGWHVRSTRHRSATLRPAPPRWQTASAPPVPRTIHAHRHRADNLLRFHSTGSAPDGARHRPATEDDLLPDARRHRPPSLPTDAANGPSTAPASNARTMPWHRPDCRRSPHRSPSMTATGRTARLSVQHPIRWPRLHQDPTRPAACSATRTSLGTAAYAPDCVAVESARRPARTGYPDVPALAVCGSSPRPAVAPALVSQTIPPATPAC